MSLFEAKDRRSLVSRAKAPLGAAARALCARTGRYRAMSPQEHETVPVGPVPFAGDVPVSAGRDHHQIRRRYARPRAAASTVANLLYTPRGIAWADGAAHERHSAAVPGLGDLIRPPRIDRAERIAQGTVVQTVTPATYGDWFDELLSTLARNIDDIVEPIVLPRRLAGKSYVLRDMEAVGRAWRFADRDLLIGSAKVLHQIEFNKGWTVETAAAMRALLRPQPPAADPGSVLYLSRRGVRSEAGDRDYPHDLVEAVVSEFGGEVLATGASDIERFKSVGRHAETVVADHGSALYNLIHWRTARVVELASDAWWNNAFLFYADTLGIADYTIIRSDLAPEETERKLRAVLSAPVRASCPSPRARPA
jgi:capsular polysaccharide biosynthesis protein